MATIDLKDYWDFEDQIGLVHAFDGINYSYDPPDDGVFTVKYVAPATRWLVGYQAYRVEMAKNSDNLHMYWCPRPWSTLDRNMVWYPEAWRLRDYLDTEWICHRMEARVPVGTEIDAANPPVNANLFHSWWPLCPWAHSLGPSPYSKRYLDTETGYRLDLTYPPRSALFWYFSADMSNFGKRVYAANQCRGWFLDVRYVGTYPGTYACGSYTGKTVRVRVKDTYPDDDRVMIEDWYLQEGQGVVRINQCYLGTWQAVEYSNPAYDDDDLHLHDKDGSNPLEDYGCGFVSTCNNIA